MVSLVVSLLMMVSLTFGFIGTSLGAEPQFAVKADGTVQFGGYQYGSMSQYFTSEEFRLNGKRCGTERGSMFHASPEASSTGPQDCTTSLTAIQNEYWPTAKFVIPIVFHIIRKADGTGDIPDSRIYHQVAALNQDYRALIGTLGGAGFDSHIQFELAGITRTTNDNWFNDNDEQGYKQALGWDQQHYLNIYANSASGYLGYAYFPQDSAGSVWDGVVVLYASCGGRDEGSAPYDQGRTLTHEIGHYLGLYHTFQGGSSCGTGYTQGDLIQDTNPEATEHYSCAQQTNTCSSPDPLSNYMNYTDDLCMQEFTSEQANRAVCSLLNYRPALYHLSRGASEKKIYIQNIIMRLKDGSAGKSFVRSVVVVKDESGNAVPNVIVSVHWTGIVEGTDFKTTNVHGKAVFNSDQTASSGTINLRVTNAYRGNKRYVTSMNVRTARSITK